MEKPKIILTNDEEKVLEGNIENQLEVINDCLYEYIKCFVYNYINELEDFNVMPKNKDLGNKSYFLNNFFLSQAYNIFSFFRKNKKVYTELWLTAYEAIRDATNEVRQAYNKKSPKTKSEAKKIFSELNMKILNNFKAMIEDNISRSQREYYYPENKK